jgi:thiol-disulfide isomerase/thioredoxin
MSFFLASGALILTFSSLAAAQDTAQRTGPTAMQSASNQQKSQARSFSEPEQPMSLGDLARLVRAKKSGQAKAVKIFDDDNMPRAPHRGDRAPEFGGSLGSTSHSQANVVLLDFWATWCGYCRDALPDLKRLRAAYGSDQLEVISVSEDEDENDWREFVTANQMTWEQRWDASHELARKYGASALPTYVLIGRDGTILQQWVGDDPGQPLVDRIGPDLQRALAGKS